MTVLQKIKNNITIWSSNFTFGDVSKIIESRFLKKYLYVAYIIHSSIVHISQVLEAIKVPINRWMNKQNMVNTYYGVLFSLNNEGNSDTYYNMAELWRHYTKWNNQDTQGQILHGFTKWKGNLQNGKKHLQTIYMIKG